MPRVNISYIYIFRCIPSCIVIFISHNAFQEDEEEGKRTDIVKAVTRPSRKKSPDEAGDRKSVSSDTQTQKEPEAAEPQSSTERPSEEHTEPELSRLLQQTDDAKVINLDLWCVSCFSFLEL